ncbi:MAG: alpha/beta fold hydrolase [Candidatus Marithrix sp.]
MKKIRYFTLVLLILFSRPLFAQEYIVLLHGLWRTSFSMHFLASYLERQGFNVVNIDYPSTYYPIKKLTKLVAKQIKMLESVEKIHFVTHSMGGVVIRDYLANNKLNNLGRVVMLSPPNQGCDIVNMLKYYLVFKFFTGPAGQQLGIEPSSFPNLLGPVEFELGVITGNFSFDWFFSYMIPGEDDGLISVERAKVEGMQDFLVVPHSHTFIMNSNKVREQITYFLKHGQFDHSQNDS